MGRSSAVATMLEEAPSIARPQRVQRATDRLYEHLAGKRPRSPQYYLDLTTCVIMIEPARLTRTART